MSIVLDGTAGITTPEVDSGPVSGTTANFSGDVTLGSSVLATPSGSAPAYLCRAWVNFNGTGTVAIRASGNVSSITDNGTGNYTVNFTTAMPDANYEYKVNGTITPGGGALYGLWSGGTTTSGINVAAMFAENGVLFDPSLISVSVIR